MQQGHPVVGDDTVVFLDKASKDSTVKFRWKNHDIFTEIDVFLVRNDRTKTSDDVRITTATSSFTTTAESASVSLEGVPGRFVANPGLDGLGTEYVVTYRFTKEKHVDPFNKKYPLFKFRIEMVGNPAVFAETNEFKVVY